MQKVPGEIIQHITSGCSRLAQTNYIYRHNQVAVIIHQGLWNHVKLKEDNTAYFINTNARLLARRTLAPFGVSSTELFSDVKIYNKIKIMYKIKI